MSVYTGNEHFSSEGMPAGYLLTDFWAWQASDLLNNTLRGVLTEFIVAKALGLRVRRMLLRTCSTGADEEIEGLSRKIAGNELAAP